MGDESKARAWGLAATMSEHGARELLRNMLSPGGDYEKELRHVLTVIVPSLRRRAAIISAKKTHKGGEHG